MGAQRSEIAIELAWIALFDALRGARPPKRRGHRSGSNIGGGGFTQKPGRFTPPTRDSVEAFLDNKDAYSADYRSPMRYDKAR